MASRKFKCILTNVGFVRMPPHSPANGDGAYVHTSVQTSAHTRIHMHMHTPFLLRHVYAGNDNLINRCYIFNLCQVEYPFVPACRELRLVHAY